MIKTILFDIDNTLIDHTEAEKKAIKWIYDEYFKQNISSKAFQEIWLEMTRKNWKLFEQKKLTFKQQQTQRIKDIWGALHIEIDEERGGKIFNQYLIKYEDSWKAFAGIEGLLSRLSVKKGVLSNGNITQQIKKLHKTNLFRFFDKKNIFTSEEIGSAKPDQKLFCYVEERLKLKNEKILYVGDTLEYDIKPALKAGWNAILIDHYDIVKNTNYEKANNAKELESLLTKKYGSNLFHDNK